MPIISPIERRGWKGRSFFLLVYLLLMLGGVSTVYPFLLMVRLSTADAVDQKRLDPIPTFWFNQDDLARKYLLRRYSKGNAKVTTPDVTAPRGADWTPSSFPDLKEFWKTYYQPFERIPIQAQRRQIADYRAFLLTLNPKQYNLVDWDVDPDFLTFREFLEGKLHLGVNDQALRYLVKVDPTIRDWHPHPDASYRASLLYAQWAKPSYRRALSPAWVTYLKNKYGQYDVAKLNTAHGAHYESWTEVVFPDVPPKGAGAVADYNDYVARQFPAVWVRVHGDFQSEWTRFLTFAKHIHTPAEWKTLTGIETSSVEAVPFLPEMPDNEAWGTLWSEFVYVRVPVAARELRSPDRLYIEYLKAKYDDLAHLNAAWSTDMKSWGDVRFAEALSDYRTLIDQSAAVKKALTVDPYRVALRLLGSQGGAILNTAILMLLALAAALTVNPLAAYALSRFRIRGTHKILLFILATMALPGEIAMVPSFLLVKNLGLMNSYLALILPGAASAFGIFLLKGFFDSLPSELYEAATLDGAPEILIFLRITIPLSTPILAVTGMGAVLGAYGTFIPAVLYLQNTDLWPLMPRIFEMSSRGGSEVTYAVNMAALVISSIPTLLVFLFAQRMIMRGIVLPTMK